MTSITKQTRARECDRRRADPRDWNRLGHQPLENRAQTIRRVALFPHVATWQKQHLDTVQIF